MYAFIQNLKKEKILYRILNKTISCHNIDLTFINAKIDALNSILENKCSNLYLKLDNYYNLNGVLTTYFNEYDLIILCLYHDNNCISSISIKYNTPYTLEIYSKTCETYTNKKYNTLLRAVIIILASDIICTSNPIRKIYSNAGSPISAWLLIKNFDVNIISDTFENLKESELKQDDTISLKQVLFNIFEKQDNYLIGIEID